MNSFFFVIRGVCLLQEIVNPSLRKVSFAVATAPLVGFYFGTVFVTLDRKFYLLDLLR